MTEAIEPGAVMSTYAQSELIFERGEGAYLYAVDGRRYLDFGAGIAVNALGHAHPALVAALTGQAGKLWHCSNLYRIAAQERLASLLVRNSFADKAFFCNSGAEAVEGAIKIARKFQYVSGAPERWRIITLYGAFHGRTVTTIAAAGNPKHLEGFGPRQDGFDQVSPGNLNELRAAITPETAGILVEPILGEGGIIPAAPDYLRGLRQTADEFGLMLIYDEVQCGIGRTGRLFAHEWAASDGAPATPDIMALAKGLGGGFPTGAVLANERAAACMGPGSHGSTFGGNPLAMAVAEAVIKEILTRGFLEHVQKIARQLRKGLVHLVASYPTIFEQCRGSGLMLALRPVGPNTEIVADLCQRSLLTVPGGDNTIRLLPPLIIGESEVEQALGILDECAKAFVGKAISSAAT